MKGERAVGREDTYAREQEDKQRTSQRLAPSAGLSLFQVHAYQSLNMPPLSSS